MHTIKQLWKYQQCSKFRKTNLKFEFEIETLSQKITPSREFIKNTENEKNITNFISLTVREEKEE